MASGEGTARKYEESCDAGGLLCDEDLVEKSPDTDIDETGSLEDDDLDCPEGDLDLARAENQLAVLSKLVLDLEVGLNELRAIIESLRVGRNG